MIRALYSAASGMTAQQLNVDNIANNLANANTTGYKMRTPQFQDLLYQSIVQPGANAGQQTTVPAGLQLGLGTRASSNEIIFTQGISTRPITRSTSRSRETAFSRCSSPTEPWPIRAMDRSRWIRTAWWWIASGNPLDPQITIPANAQSMTIATDGTVSYLTARPVRRATGRADPARHFQNPAGLNSIGKNLYQPTDASGDATVAAPGGTEGFGTLMQGYTEQSNVSVVDEFINLIVAQRAYEANSKVVKAADEMYQQVNNLKQ